MSKYQTGIEKSLVELTVSPGQTQLHMDIWYIIKPALCWGRDKLCSKLMLNNLVSMGEKCEMEPLPLTMASLVAQMVKSLPAVQETQVWSLGQEDPLEKGMATPSSSLAWKISWTEEPCRLQSMGLQRVRHHWVTSLSLLTSVAWRHLHCPVITTITL